MINLGTLPLVRKKILMDILSLTARLQVFPATRRVTFIGKSSCCFPSHTLILQYTKLLLFHYLKKLQKKKNT